MEISDDGGSYDVGFVISEKGSLPAGFSSALSVSFLGVFSLLGSTFSLSFFGDWFSQSALEGDLLQVHKTDSYFSTVTGVSTFGSSAAKVLPSS